MRPPLSADSPFLARPGATTRAFSGDGGGGAPMDNPAAGTATGPGAGATGGEGEAPATREEREGVAAVERALTLLCAWREGDTALPLRELAKRTGLYKSTILRLMASLERYRCVHRRADGYWVLGPVLFHWGALYRRGLALDALVPPVLARLAEATGESATYWVREGDQRVCVFAVTAPRVVQHAAQPGDRLPLGNGASGTVLAADGRPGVVAIEGGRDPDAAAVSAPVLGSGGELRGALTVAGPRARLWPEVERIKPLVHDAATALSRALGGDLPGC